MFWSLNGSLVWQLVLWLLSLLSLSIISKWSHLRNPSCPLPTRFSLCRSLRGTSSLCDQDHFGFTEIQHASYSPLFHVGVQRWNFCRIFSFRVVFTMIDREVCMSAIMPGRCLFFMHIISSLFRRIVQWWKPKPHCRSASGYIQDFQFEEKGFCFPSSKNSLYPRNGWAQSVQASKQQRSSFEKKWLLLSTWTSSSRSRNSGRDMECTATKRCKWAGNLSRKDINTRVTIDWKQWPCWSQYGEPCWCNSPSSGWCRLLCVDLIPFNTLSIQQDVFTIFQSRGAVIDGRLSTRCSGEE